MWRINNYKNKTAPKRTNSNMKILTFERGRTYIGETNPKN